MLNLSIILSIYVQFLNIFFRTWSHKKREPCSFRSIFLSLYDKTDGFFGFFSRNCLLTRTFESNDCKVRTKRQGASHDFIQSPLLFHLSRSTIYIAMRCQGKRVRYLNGVCGLKSSRSSSSNIKSPMRHQHQTTVRIEPTIRPVSPY